MAATAGEDAIIPMQKNIWAKFCSLLELGFSRRETIIEAKASISPPPKPTATAQTENQDNLVTVEPSNIAMPLMDKPTNTNIRQFTS